MSSFWIEGPFRVPITRGRGGVLRIARAKEQIARFWNSVGYVADERGCYVFTVRGRPYYVGMTMRSFRVESLGPHQMKRYNEALRGRDRPSPRLFLIAQKKDGGFSEAHIRQLEAFLINAGYQRNADITNVVGKKVPNWSVDGLIRSGSGRRSKAASELGHAMGFLPTV
ncbi:MAG: hypothetical protein HY680_09725 [Chloroflexi bacterium]|nr:hypothetical protein [Chloroflexota bacterium]